MTTSKKVFLVVALLFILAVLWVSYDIARKTTFPGGQPQLKERIEKEFLDE